MKYSPPTSTAGARGILIRRATVCGVRGLCTRHRRNADAATRTGGGGENGAKYIEHVYIERRE